MLRHTFHIITTGDGLVQFVTIANSGIKTNVQIFTTRLAQVLTFNSINISHCSASYGTIGDYAGGSNPVFQKINTRNNVGSGIYLNTNTVRTFQYYNLIGNEGNVVFIGGLTQTNVFDSFVIRRQTYKGVPKTVFVATIGANTIIRCSTDASLVISGQLVNESPLVVGKLNLIHFIAKCGPTDYFSNHREASHFHSMNRFVQMCASLLDVFSIFRHPNKTFFFILE